MKYKNLSNKKIYIDDKEITSGGQGTIHKVSNSNSVAKIYKDLNKLKKDKLDKKIQFMIANPPFDSTTPQEIRDSIIWPIDVLYDKRGFVGFIMPFVKDSIELSNLVFMKKKQSTNPIIQKFKKTNNSDFFRQRLIMCYNLASVLKVIHQRNQYVIVDLKPQNILIDVTGKIVLIDIDSIQVKTYNNIYYADAWTDDYAPPEFHNRKINPKDEISPSWDYFAFASTAYQILFQIPAFAGSISGHTTLVENIAKKYFPHGKNRAKYKVIPPPHKEFKQLNNDLKKAFIDTFEKEANERIDFGNWTDAFLLQLKSIKNKPKTVKKTKKSIKSYKVFSNTIARIVSFFSKFKNIFKVIILLLLSFAIIFYIFKYIKESNKIEVFENLFDSTNYYFVSKGKIGKMLSSQKLGDTIWEEHIISTKKGNIIGWIRKDDL